MGSKPAAIGRGFVRQPPRISSIQCRSFLVVKYGPGGKNFVASRFLPWNTSVPISRYSFGFYFILAFLNVLRTRMATASASDESCSLIKPQIAKNARKQWWRQRPTRVHQCSRDMFPGPKEYFSLIAYIYATAIRLMNHITYFWGGIWEEEPPSSVGSETFNLALNLIM